MFTQKSKRFIAKTLRLGSGFNNFLTVNESSEIIVITCLTYFVYDCYVIVLSGDISREDPIFHYNSERTDFVFDVSCESQSHENFCKYYIRFYEFFESFLIHVNNIQLNLFSLCIMFNDYDRGLPTYEYICLCTVGYMR